MSALRPFASAPPRKARGAFSHARERSARAPALPQLGKMQAESSDRKRASPACESMQVRKRPAWIARSHDRDRILAKWRPGLGLSSTELTGACAGSAAHREAQPTDADSCLRGGRAARSESNVENTKARTAEGDGELDEASAAAHRETSRLFLLLQKEVDDALKARAERDRRNVEISHGLAARHPLAACSSCNCTVESSGPMSAEFRGSTPPKAHSQMLVAASSPASTSSSGATTCTLSGSSRGSTPTLAAERLGCASNAARECMT